MLNLTSNILKQLAKMRLIKGYNNMSKEGYWVFLMNQKALTMLKQERLKKILINSGIGF